MYKGIYVPVITPFFADGSIDLGSLSKLCERFIEQGVSGIILLGTTGEASSLSTTERHEVVATCAKAIAGTDVELVVGAGTNSTTTTIERMDEFAEFSPNAFLIVTPYYVRPSEQGIIEHFLIAAQKADEIGSDVLLYNIPIRTGRCVSTDGLLECSKHSRIVGVKQAVGSLDDETLLLISKNRDDFSILAGDDYLAAPITLLGGKGAVAASAHLATNMWVEMVDAALSSNLASTLEIHNKLLPLVKAGFGEPNPSVFKGALASTGEIASDFVRLPLMTASKESINQYLNILNKL